MLKRLCIGILSYQGIDNFEECPFRTLDSHVHKLQNSHRGKQQFHQMLMPLQQYYLCIAAVNLCKQMVICRNTRNNYSESTWPEEIKEKNLHTSLAVITKRLNTNVIYSRGFIQHTFILRILLEQLHTFTNCALQTKPKQ